jgi:hypothetical protein
LVASDRFLVQGSDDSARSRVGPHDRVENFGIVPKPSQTHLNV